MRAVNGDSAGQSTKRRIEEAALHLFAAKGFEATGIRDIADRVGISTAALYHYMGSKDELLVDFMLVSMTQLTRAAREALATADEPASELAALVRTHVGFHTLDPLRSLVADDELRSLSEEALARVMVLRDSYEALWADTAGARAWPTASSTSAMPGLPGWPCWKCATESCAGIRMRARWVPPRSLTRSPISPWRWSAPGARGVRSSWVTCGARRPARFSRSSSAYCGRSMTWPCGRPAVRAGCRAAGGIGRGRLSASGSPEPSLAA